jgi:hypothetical protein
MRLKSRESELVNLTFFNNTKDIELYAKILLLLSFWDPNLIFRPHVSTVCQKYDNSCLISIFFLATPLSKYLFTGCTLPF